MPEDPDSLAEVGWCKFKIGDKEGAEQSLNQALSLNQDNINTLSYLGIIYSVSEKNNEAYATWSRCVLLNPKNADFKLRLGDACVNIDKYDEAINSYKDALSLNKKLTEANFGIAFAKLKKAISGEKTDRVLLEEALAAFKNITVSEPKNDLAWTNLGVCYFKLNRYNDASLAYKKALSINPKNTEAQKNSAELDKAMKN
ncbi:MAG: tetratricopeptide repeat protein [Armatimonadetes bacterium]|nr:tetratricopeptide repeat protein [Candidatus Hippobium faecium]